MKNDYNIDHLKFDLDKGVVYLDLKDEKVMKMVMSKMKKQFGKDNG